MSAAHERGRASTHGELDGIEGGAGGWTSFGCGENGERNTQSEGGLYIIRRVGQAPRFLPVPPTFLRASSWRVRGSISNLTLSRCGVVYRKVGTLKSTVCRMSKPSRIGCEGVRQALRH